MIDNLRSYLAPIPLNQRINRLREYLQILILRAIDLRGFSKNLVFVGGTALRIVYENNRFSEDLDFSLMPGRTLTFDTIAGEIEKDLKTLGFTCSCSQLKNEKTIASCFYRFSNLLHQLGLSTNTNQKLSIKLEVDTQPPEGGMVMEYFNAGPLLFSVNHHDLPSLFACKLHALFFRPYTKGRDFFDLLFFMSKKTMFNLTLLNNAAHQTNPEAAVYSVDTVINRLKDRLENIDEKMIVKDLSPFLLEPGEIRYFTARNLLHVLQQNITAGVYHE